MSKILYLEAVKIKRSGSLPRAKHRCPRGVFNSAERKCFRICKQPGNKREIHGKVDEEPGRKSGRFPAIAPSCADLQNKATRGPGPATNFCCCKIQFFQGTKMQNTALQLKSPLEVKCLLPFSEIQLNIQTISIRLNFEPIQIRLYFQPI